MLSRFANSAIGVPSVLIQAHAGGTVPFDLVLNPHENFGVYGLWASVATPQTTRYRSEQKQRQGADNEQTSEIDEVLWVQDEVEDVKASGL